MCALFDAQHTATAPGSTSGRSACRMRRGADEVDVDHRPPLAHRRRDAGGVRERTECPRPWTCSARRCHRVGVGDVGDRGVYPFGPGGVLGEVGAHRVELRGVEIDEEHGLAGTQQSSRRGEAHAARRAGHDRDTGAHGAVTRGLPVARRRPRRAALLTEGRSRRATPRRRASSAAPTWSSPATTEGRRGSDLPIVRVR